MIIQNTKTSNIKPIKTNRTSHAAPIHYTNDAVSIENSFVDKKPLVDRKIIKPQDNINKYFDKISSQIFPDSSVSHSLSKFLQMGYISLSSNTYADLKNPKSAIGLKLDEKKSSVQHCAQLEQHIKDGAGVGINFSNFENPKEKIKYINNYFKYREPNLNRPPAGIALLNINHPQIMEFISLKDNANYQDWCFDLSVVMDSSFLSKVDKNEDLTLADGNKISAKNVYLKLLTSMKNSGEPGIIFSDEKDFICDSCAASQLSEDEGLNLIQINLSKFVNPKTQKMDYAFLSQAANVSAMTIKRIAPNGFISILGYQDLLNKLNQDYGSTKALETLDKSLSIIKEQADMNSARMCISPSGTTSRILKTTPSIEPINNPKATYWDEIATMETAQKYLDGGISKTFNLKPHHTIQDIDLIIRSCQSKGLKGISVFPAQ